MTDGGADGNSHWHNTADGVEDRESYLGSGMRDNHYFVYETQKQAFAFWNWSKKFELNSLLANLGSALENQCDWIPYH